MKEKEYLIEQVSTLLSSGIDISTAIKSIQKEIKSKKLKKSISSIEREIEDGSSFWMSLKKSGLYPKHIISLIKIGEESGNLPKNLKLVVEQGQKERKFRSKIRSASLYPLIVLSLTFVIGIGITWFILPRLSTVFSKLKIELPFITKILISIGKFFENYGIIAIPLLVFIIIMLVYLVFFHSGSKFIGQYILFKIPGIKNLIQEIEISRFGYMLGILLKASMPIDTAIDTLKNACDFYSYKKFYSFLHTNVSEGNSLKKSFHQYNNTQRLIPTPTQQIIISGENSGSLADSLLSIAKNYEEKSDNTSKNLSVILEPILLVIVWLGVVFIAFAVILPLYSLIGGFEF